MTRFGTLPLRTVTISIFYFYFRYIYSPLHLLCMEIISAKAWPRLDTLIATRVLHTGCQATPRLQLSHVSLCTSRVDQHSQPHTMHCMQTLTMILEGMEGLMGPNAGRTLGLVWISLKGFDVCHCAPYQQPPGRQGCQLV